MLSHENYHSKESNAKYMSCSQYKNFAGSLGQLGCEAKAVAMLNGDWEDKHSTALYVGSYVDAHFSGTLDLFKGKTPEIFKKDGTLKSDYTKADDIIQRIERDPFFMKYMSGEKQVIMTAELFGVEWRIMVDSLVENIVIVDLKVMKSIRESKYVRDHGHMSFIEYWNYDIQGAIYQAVVEKNTGKKLPFFIAAASKEAETDIEIIGIDDKTLDARLYEVERYLPRIIEVKEGGLEPIRCEVCDYCTSTKVLSRPIHFSELTGRKI